MPLRTVAGGWMGCQLVMTSLRRKIAADRFTSPHAGSEADLGSKGTRSTRNAATRLVLRMSRGRVAGWPLWAF